MTHIHVAYLTRKIVSLKTSDPESVELQNISNLCEEPEFVFEYLEEWFVQDKLAKYFVDSKGILSLLNSFLLTKQ